MRQGEEIAEFSGSLGLISRFSLQLTFRNRASRRLASNRRSQSAEGERCVDGQGACSRPGEIGTIRRIEGQRLLVFCRHRLLVTQRQKAMGFVPAQSEPSR